MAGARATSWARVRPCCTAFSSFCRAIGFSRKFRAPMRVASTAVSIVAWPDIMMTGMRQQAVALPFLEQRDAVGIRHPDVEQHQVGRALLARARGPAARFRPAAPHVPRRPGFPRAARGCPFHRQLRVCSPSCSCLPDLVTRLRSTAQILCAIHASAKFASGANFNSKIDTEAPVPSARLATSIRPPCSSTIFLTIGRPRPVPRAFDVT